MIDFQSGNGKREIKVTNLDKEEKHDKPAVSKLGEVTRLKSGSTVCVFGKGVYTLMFDKGQLVKLHDALLGTEFHDAVCALLSLSNGGVLQFYDED